MEEKEMSYNELRARLTDTMMAGGMPQGEAVWGARMILEALTGRSFTDLLVRGDDQAVPATVSTALTMAERAAKGEPLQYIIGFEWFMGLKIGVGPGVLIPRRETEELAQLIVDREKGKDDLRVLDLYTGSGCIALALARSLPFSRVIALDLSPAAIARATANARDLRVKMQIVQADALKWQPSPDSFDIITANPPYVLESERAEMERNVLDHEPAEALFVPDSDPLLHYRAAARIAAVALVSGGRLYMEINPLEADALKAMLQTFPASERGASHPNIPMSTASLPDNSQSGKNTTFTDIEILRDTSSRPRFALARKR